MEKEKLAYKLSEEAVTVDFWEAGIGCCGIKSKDTYIVSVLGWRMQDFYTEEGANKFRDIICERIKATALKILKETVE